MTKDQQAALEQVAREWLIARGWCHLDASYQRVPVQGDVLALVTLLAAQRAAVLEEVIAEAKRRAYAIGLNEPLRTNYLYGFACDLESQPKEQRP